MGLPYCVAVAFVDGEVVLSTFDSVGNENKGNAEERAGRDLVIRLAANTTVVATEEMDRWYPDTRLARNVVTTSYGRSLERVVECSCGAAELLLSVVEVTEKFRSLSANGIYVAERDGIINDV
jgi:2-methylcitrate dehydratase PrpD